MPVLKSEVYKRVLEEDSVDGVLIAIGGRDDTVPVHLQDGRTVYKCNTSRTRAKEMAAHLFGSPLRVTGLADWRREEDGSWQLNNLVIEHFDVLKDEPAVDVIDNLRSIPGNYWHLQEDPYELLKQLRDGTGDTN